MPDMFTLLVSHKDACMAGILAQQLALQKKYAYRHPLIGGPTHGVSALAAW